MNIDKNDIAKKKIFFSPYDDYNYLVFNIFVILDFFECYSEDTALVDYRKISFIADFINNDYLWNEMGNDFSPVLMPQFHFCRQRCDLLERVIFALKEKNILEVTGQNCFLREKELFPVRNEVFFKVFEKLALLKKKHTRIRGMKLSTLNENLYGIGEQF